MNTQESNNSQPSPPTTTPSRPGDIGGTGGGYTPSGPTYAGGINPSYKAPTSDKFGNPADPYFYTNEDWQMLLSRNSDDVRVIQQKLMAAYPGFQPKVMGDKFDANTIKYFKYALNRINQFTADTTDSYKIRGKSLDKALDVLVNNPAVGGSTALRTYSVTSPTDLKAVFKKAAQDMLGRTLQAGDLDRFVAAYQQQQIAYQKAAASGGTAVTAPSAQEFAVDQLSKDFSEEVDTRKMDNVFSTIDQLLSKGK